MSDKKDGKLPNSPPSSAEALLGVWLLDRQLQQQHLRRCWRCREAARTESLERRCAMAKGGGNAP